MHGLNVATELLPAKVNIEATHRCPSLIIVLGSLMVSSEFQLKIPEH